LVDGCFGQGGGSSQRGFFSELENLYYTPNPSSFTIASFEAVQKNLQTSLKSENNMKKIVFSDL
jgi:hypothetical protein